MVSAQRMTGSIVVVIVTAVTDGVGTVCILSSWYFPLPREKGTRERFILRVSCISAQLGFKMIGLFVCRGLNYHCI